MNITELQQHPELFEKAYCDYCINELDYEWWNLTIEDIKSQWVGKKLDVDNIYFDLYRRDIAFEGTMNTRDFLKMQGIEETHLALAALHATGDSARLNAYTSHRCNMQESEINETDAYYLQYQTLPCGIFEGMDEDEWSDLVGREIDSVVEAWDGFCNNLAYGMLRKLDDEYEYLTSEEVFVEWADANEIEFDGDEDGDGR